MPSTESVNLANLERKNLPHIAADLNMLEPQPILNGLFRFEHKNQAHNMPVSNKYHQIQSVTTVSSSAFTAGGNGFIDFNLPMNIDLIDEITLQFTLQNTDTGTDWVSSASVPFFFQRFEVRHDNEILQTRKDIHLYLDNTIYLDTFEMIKNLPLIGLDPKTYQAESTYLTVLKSSTSTFRLKLNTLLEKNKIFVKGLRGQLVIRVYPQNVSVFSATPVTSLLLQSMMLVVKELELSPDGRNKMMDVHRKNVDYRYLDIVDEQANLALVNGATTKYVTNNFHNQIYSHVLVLTRAQNSTTTALETFIQHNNVYFQDASSNSLSNGIQWSDSDLRLLVYQNHFPNSMTQVDNMNVYPALVASTNPLEAWKKGSQNGYEILPRNAQLCINAAASATREVQIICYAYTHLRHEGGKLVKY